MSILGDRIIERGASEEQIALCEIVAKGMAPFKTGVISMAIESEPDFLSRVRTLWIEVETLKRFPFRHKFDERMMPQAYYPDQYLLDAVAQPLFDHFRYRPAVPADDHIILGEN